jgi:hypothetical protein
LLNGLSFLNLIRRRHLDVDIGRGDLTMIVEERKEEEERVCGLEEGREMESWGKYSLRSVVPALCHLQPIRDRSFCLWLWWYVEPPRGKERRLGRALLRSPPQDLVCNSLTTPYSREIYPVNLAPEISTSLDM